MNAATLTEQPQNLPIPRGFTPEGVDLALFDEQTLYLVEHALPPLYRGMLAHLLYYGTLDPRTTMQSSLFAATGESNDEAIILYRSVGALSKSPQSQWGPETYHKGILIYESLKIIKRVFHRNYTEIRVPLGKREIHIPSLLQELRDLYEEYNNDKVKGLAIRVARNLKSGDFAKYTSLKIAPEIKSALAQLLQEHGIEEGKIKPMSLSMACKVIAQTIQAERRVSAGKGEFPHGHTGRLRKSGIQKGDSNCQLGELAARIDGEERDQAGTASAQKGEFDANESPRSVMSCRKTRRCQYAKGELDEIFGTESPEFASEAPFSLYLGDSDANVSIIGQYPSDIPSKRGDTIIDGKTETLPYKDKRDIEEIRREAVLYESLFDGRRGRKFTGSLIDVVRETPPEAKRSAAVAALFYSNFPLPDGRLVGAPGGFFTTVCRKYNRPNAKIPAEVRAWDETGQPLKSIKDALEQGIRHPAQPQLLPPDGSGEDQEVVGQSEESSPLQTTYELPGGVHCRQGRNRGYMSRDDAQRLWGCVKREGRSYNIEAAVVPDEERTDAFVVMITWDGWQEPMHNEDEWIQYFADTSPLMQKIH